MNYLMSLNKKNLITLLKHAILENVGKTHLKNP